MVLPTFSYVPLLRGMFLFDSHSRGCITARSVCTNITIIAEKTGQTLLSKSNLHLCDRNVGAF